MPPEPAPTWKRWDMGLILVAVACGFKEGQEQRMM